MWVFFFHLSDIQMHTAQALTVWICLFKSEKLNTYVRANLELEEKGIASHTDCSCNPVLNEPSPV